MCAAAGGACCYPVMRSHMLTECGPCQVNLRSSSSLQQAMLHLSILQVAVPPSSVGPVVGSVSSPQAAQGCMGLGLFGMSSAPKVAVLKPSLMAASVTGMPTRLDPCTAPASLAIHGLLS